LHLPGSALEGGAVFNREGQAAIRIDRSMVQQAAPELFVEGGDLAVLLFQNPEEVLHRAAPVLDVADLLCDRILLGLGLLELLAEGIEALVVSIVKKRIGVCTVFVCGSDPFWFQHQDLKINPSFTLSPSQKLTTGLRKTGW